MDSINFIKMSLEMSKGWLLGLAMDMKDEPLVAPTPHGGNHPLWCVGHLAFAEANLVNVMAQGKENPLAGWEPLFNQGTTPSQDASAYPSFDEVVAKFEETRNATLSYVDSLTPASLDEPSKAEGEAAEWFGTIGACLAAIPIHFAFHGGQIADARRAAGRPPMMG